MTRGRSHQMPPPKPFRPGAASARAEVQSPATSASRYARRTVRGAAGSEGRGTRVAAVPQPARTSAMTMPNRNDRTAILSATLLGWGTVCLGARRIDEPEEEAPASGWQARDPTREVRLRVLAAAERHPLMFAEGLAPDL